MTCQAMNWTLKESARNRHQAAFTLLELTAVLALAVALLALASFSWRVPYRAAQFEDALGRIEFFDRSVREHAIRFDVSAKLEIGLTDGTLTEAGDGAAREGQRQLRLNPLFRIERVQTSLGQITHGTATIDISARGQSPSYSLQLIDANGQRLWMVFAGVTGQVMRFNKENDVREIHRLFAAQRADAH